MADSANPTAAAFKPSNNDSLFKNEPKIVATNETHAHYGYIPNISRLTGSRKRNNVCYRCLTSFGRKEALACQRHKSVVTMMPAEGATLQYKAGIKNAFHPSAQPQFICCIDTETTNLHTRFARVVSWSAFCADKFAHAVQVAVEVVHPITLATVFQKTWYVSDSPPSAPTAFEVHKLAPEFLLLHGVPMSTVLAELSDTLDAPQVCGFLLGFNVNFDVKVLLAACRRAGDESLFQRIKNMRTIDVAELVRKNAQDFPRLKEAARRYGIETTKPLHDAASDVAVTVNIYRALTTQHPALCQRHTTTPRVPLTSEQHVVLDHVMSAQASYSVLVEACPGAGKTFLILRVLSELVAQGRCHRNKIILMTFNKALARSYSEELRAQGVNAASLYHAGTLDSMAWRLRATKIWTGDRNIVRQCVLEGFQFALTELTKLRKCTHIFVDEYQDLTAVHYAFLAQIQQQCPSASWFVAGDIRQTLYSRQGASPHQMQTFRPWTRFELNTTLRCPDTVAKICSAVFAGVDWETSAWAPHRATFERPFHAHRNDDSVSAPAVLYRRLAGSDSEVVVNLLCEEISARYVKGETISVLTPAKRSRNAMHLLKDIELALSIKFGPMFVMRIDNVQRDRNFKFEHAMELQTIHSAKGRTIDHVFVLYAFECCDDKVDWAFQSSSAESCIKLFVAASRARKTLTFIDNRPRGGYFGCLELWRHIPPGVLRPDSDEPDMRVLQPGNNSPWSMSVVDFCKRVGCGELARPFPLQMPVQVDDVFRDNSFRHPFAMPWQTYLPTVVRAQLGNESLWCLYGLTVERYVGACLNMVTDTPDPVACWNSCRDEAYRDKTILAEFDLNLKMLTPPKNNSDTDFWPVLHRATNMLLGHLKSSDLTWQPKNILQPMPMTLPCGTLVKLEKGIPDIVWKPEKDKLVIMDLKVVVDEHKVQSPEFEGWLQLQCYANMLIESPSRIELRIWSLLSGKVYTLVAKDNVHQTPVSAPIRRLPMIPAATVENIERGRLYC